MEGNPPLSYGSLTQDLQKNRSEVLHKEVRSFLSRKLGSEPFLTFPPVSFTIISAHIDVHRSRDEGLLQYKYESSDPNVLFF